MVRHLLLDADGVVQHRPGGWDDVLAGHTADPGGLFGDLVIEEAPTVRGAGDFLPVLADALRRRGITADPEQVHADVWGRIEPHVGLLSWVGELRDAGAEVHLASNQHPERAALMRHRLGYGELFDTCFFSCELGAAKPSEEFFEKVLDALRATPQEVVFVDDSTTNTRAARGIGMRAITWHHRQGLARLRRQVVPQP
ncbi:HAD family hydrolase [Nocardioides alcanivorans]|uniref:HAD family hydrolase n=1 Tax=Nocardioides alcanivorans TaxID=2897352 RepID=UPI001F47A5C0|nr:HAD-IA family hydrolase [Nocardioides alcanivorans]